MMTQDMVVEISNQEGEYALIVCKGCGKLVPKTNLCLYCGSPILFKKPVPS